MENYLTSVARKRFVATGLLTVLTAITVNATLSNRTYACLMSSQYLQYLNSIYLHKLVVEYSFSERTQIGEEGFIDLIDVHAASRIFINTQKLEHSSYILVTYNVPVDTAQCRLCFL